MSQKLALIIGNSEYEDTTLVRLVTPSADVRGLARTLKTPDIGGFDKVTTLVDEPGDTIRRAIARLFAGKKREDLLLLYFSGHGVRDDQGDLYLAVKDTEREFLSATAIPATFITDEMDRSRSRRQVLVLDCCHSGAFVRGAKGIPGGSVGTAAAFEGTGYGRVVLTATDSTQYAWEGDQVIGEAENSVFTHYLIQGLRTGEADANADGRITLDELYEYVYEQVVNKTPRQTPGKWTYKQQGDIVIAWNPRPVVKAVELPLELQQAIESPFAGVREGAVRELDRMLRGSHAGLALAAHAALTRLTGDDSRRVSTVAHKSLAAYAETQRPEETEAERKAAYARQAETGRPAIPQLKPTQVSAPGPTPVMPARARTARNWLPLLLVGAGVLVAAVALSMGLITGMGAILTLIIGGVAIALGYGVYARNINKNVIQPNDKKATPARRYMDGADFTPANRHILFGYQFKSIATLGTLTGPIIAVQWGWLPALMWIILGTLFIGWVQNYGAMIMGVRHDGDTMGTLSHKLISPRAHNILMIFTYFYLLLIMGAYGNAVGRSLMANPTVYPGVIAVVLMGILAGQMIYKWKQDIILTTVVTVVLAFAGIWVSTLPFMYDIFSALHGFPDSPSLFLRNTQARVLATLLMIIFCYLGSVLPIWSFAQPVNYVSFWIVSLGMLGGTIGLLIWHPTMGDFPAFTTFTTVSGPLWPMLLVTITGGAVSGWHSLVSTSGTARQLEKETDALPVGGGAMFMEMAFAVIAFLAATVGFGSWQGYQDIGGAGGAGTVFSQGLANFLGYIGIPQDFGVSYGYIFMTIMALTIMPLVVRFMREASAELVGDALPVMKNVHVGTIVALALTLLFVWIIPWLTIWAAFGAANQLMAGLALLLISVWLRSEGRKYTWAFYPSIFMIITAIAALFYLAYYNFFVKLPATDMAQTSIAAILVGIIALVLMVAAALFVLDGWKALRKLRTR